MIRYLTLGILVSVQAGCSTQMIPHAWQVDGNQNVVAVRTDGWRKLPRGSLCPVDPGARPSVVERLNGHPAIELTVEEVRDLCDEAPVGQHGDRPYLVRGVAEASAPWCSLARYDDSMRQLLVYQAWYNGENMLTVGGRVGPSPIIVYLPTPPLAVYPVGEEMGDWLGATECFRDEAEHRRMVAKGEA